MTHLSTPSHPDNPSRPLSEEAIAAGQYLKNLITQRPAVPLADLNEGFERYGARATHSTHQIHMLLEIMKDVHLTAPGSWKKVEHTLRLCHKAGWIQPASFLTQRKEGGGTEESYYGVGIEGRYYEEIWRGLGYDCRRHWEMWEDYMRTFAYHTPARLEEIGETLSLFLTLLPPPRGVRTHIESAFHAFDFPLAHALRLGLKHQTLPRFSEQAFHDHLLTGFLSGYVWKAAACTDLLGQMVFQEAQAWTENLSASFFEKFLQQFMTTEHVTLEEGRSRSLSQEEKDIGEQIVRGAQSLHTKALLTQDMALASAHSSPRQRL